MEFSYFLKSVGPGLIMELLAALAGSYYLYTIKDIKRIDYYLLAFLWFTFIVDTMGGYAPIAYFSDYQYFSFIKDTNFESNYWLYNSFMIISFGFLTYYFRSFLINEFRRKLLKISIYSYLLLAIINLIFSDIFFSGYSQFSLLTGTFLLLSAIFLFYFELLKNDTILRLKQFLPFYISVGVLIFYLCVTPIEIFSEYFKIENKLFVKLKINIMKFVNIFMYSAYILGFILCSRKKKSS